jgi:hypothetical protein
MKTTLQLVLGLALALSGALGHAAPVSTTLEDVTIGTSTYDITFVQDDDGFTTFNDVFGADSPTLTFTTQDDALAAITAIRAAVDAANLDVTPADFRNAFTLPFAFTADTFSYFAAWVDDPIFDGVFGPFERSRTTTQLFSTFALVEESRGTVPEPGTIALLGAALAGIAVLRRARRPSSKAKQEP